MASVEEQPLRTDEKVVTKKTFRQKLRHIKDNITVEPVLACYVVPGVLARLATQNLNIDKACRVNKNYGDIVCDALIAQQGTSYKGEELAVQELIATMESWKNVLLTAIPSFLILFIGAWSDKTRKRKICILVPIVGELLMCLSNIVSAYFFYEMPVGITMFFEALFPAITGGWITMYMGAFSYISDASSKESRTFRVGIANLCLTAGGPIGSVLSGFLITHIGYYGVFTLSSVMYLFSIIYGYYYINDPKKVEEKKDPTNVRGFLKSFFDINHVKDALNVAFKKGPNNRRTKSILVLMAIGFIYGPAYGESTVRYLFTRNRFNWDALKYSFYNTFYICIHSLGALISISLFSHRLKWDDSVLGLISNGSKVIGSLATGFARNTKEMYIAVAIEMFNATSFTALRSISSKLSTSDELGKMTSVFNLMEVVTSMIFGPIYSWIYKVTLDYDAGLFYYVSTVLTLPAFVIFGWFFIEHRNTKEETVDGKGTEKLNELQVAKHKEDLLSSIDVADEKIL